MTNSLARILVAEDETSLNDLLQDALRMNGYETISAKHGMEAVRLIREEKPDLVILDINMPQLDGFGVIEKLRNENNNIPIIVLTARDQKDDKSIGFGLGADDFVTKPFGLEELLMRVAAVLRRSKNKPTEGNVLVNGNISLDILNYRVSVNDKEIETSPTEFKLLQYLMENSGRVLTREQILSVVWGLDFATDGAVLDTYISYLRKKLGDSAYIRTVRGIGYQIEAK
ncbi:MAG: response regulator transcription factor [Candidatus Nanopelagicales bacterium]|nr:response regulator transcription factor [Candidatus Nanopelagicales bacterium]